MNEDILQSASYGNAANQRLLTVFTPAYNRAHTIGRTYESLLNQTSHDFVWLVVDDGSADNTRELVAQWVSDDKIPILYVRQQNQGMHGAHNTAYRHCVTELNTCIDSDDYMPLNAVERIAAFWREHGSDKWAGILGLDQDTNGKILGTTIPEGMTHTTLQGFYAAGGTGDKKLVYRTSVIKSYPDYPLFEGERYVGLAYKYMLCDQDYELLTLNEPLVTVDYQLDGSSYGMYRQYWNNPKGFAFFRRTEMVTTKSLKRRFVVCAHYVSSCIIGRNGKWLSESPRKLLTLLAAPAGVALWWHIRRKVKAQAKMKFN